MFAIIIKKEKKLLNDIGDSNVVKEKDRYTEEEEEEVDGKEKNAIIIMKARHDSDGFT